MPNNLSNNNMMPKNMMNETPNNMPNNMMPNNMMPNNMMDNQNMENMSNQNLEEMFPELYKKIKPQIDQIAGELQNQQISDEMIDSIIQEILTRTDMLNFDDFWDYDMDDMQNTLAVQGNFNYGRYPRYRNPYYSRRRRYPRYRNITMEDFIRLMLLRRLGRCDRNCPYY